jgi:hypothetical protein
MNVRRAVATKKPAEFRGLLQYQVFTTRLKIRILRRPSDSDAVGSSGNFNSGAGFSG